MELRWMISFEVNIDGTTPQVWLTYPGPAHEKKPIGVSLRAVLITGQNTINLGEKLTKPLLVCCWLGNCMSSANPKTFQTRGHSPITSHMPLPMPRGMHANPELQVGNKLSVISCCD